MTAATLSALPLAAGSALLHSAGRVGIWAIAHYFRAPLANTGILAMVTLTAMAGSNALYNQTMRHPAPFFAPATEVAALAAEPAEPAVRKPKRQAVATAPVEQATGSIAPQAVPVDAMGNSEVFALQKKLLELGYFNGTVDGYYGPQTAAAIRAFEQKAGLKPLGALDRDVVATIMRASSIEAVAQPAPVVAEPVTPKSVVTQLAVTEAPAPKPVQQLAILSQPAPQPLPVKPATRQVQALRIVPGQPVVTPVEDDPAGEVLDAAADTAAGTFDAIAGMVGDLASTRAMPGESVKPKPLPVKAAPAPQPVAAAAPVETPATASVTDVALVAKVQRGLASLGFLAGSIDGVAGEATSKAIRNFEVYYNYDVTGEITPELVGMLKSAGAVI